MMQFQQVSFTIFRRLLFKQYCSNRRPMDFAKKRFVERNGRVAQAPPSIAFVIFNFLLFINIHFLFFFVLLFVLFLLLFVRSRTRVCLQRVGIVGYFSRNGTAMRNFGRQAMRCLLWAESYEKF
jgi:hypothetical protein